MLGFVDILIHTLPGEKTSNSSKECVFLGNYNFASSSPIRVCSVEIIVQNVPHVVHAVKSIFYDFIQTNAYPL